MLEGTGLVFAASTSLKLSMEEGKFAKVMS